MPGDFRGLAPRGVGDVKEHHNRVENLDPSLREKLQHTEGMLQATAAGIRVFLSRLDDCNKQGVELPDSFKDGMKQLYAEGGPVAGLDNDILKTDDLFNHLTKELWKFTPVGWPK